MILQVLDELGCSDKVFVMAALSLLKYSSEKHHAIIIVNLFVNF